MEDLTQRRILDALGRLLAAENLTFVYDSGGTAYIDMATRVIHMPTWDVATANIALILRAHEVGHALYTPPEGWHSAIEKNYTDRPSLQSYLNILEDSRIERLMKMKYPGLVQTFRDGYTDIVNEGIAFTSEKMKYSSNMRLIDKINCVEKVGFLYDVPMNAEEKQFLTRAQTTMSWEEVVALAEEIYDWQAKNINLNGFADSLTFSSKYYDLDELRRILGDQEDSEDLEIIENPGSGEGSITIPAETIHKLIGQGETGDNYGQDLESASSPQSVEDLRKMVVDGAVASETDVEIEKKDGSFDTSEDSQPQKKTYSTVLRTNAWKTPGSYFIPLDMSVSSRVMVNSFLEEDDLFDFIDDEEEGLHVD